MSLKRCTIFRVNPIACAHCSSWLRCGLVCFFFLRLRLVLFSATTAVVVAVVVVVVVVAVVVVNLGG